MKVGFLSFAHLHADAYVGNLRAAGVEIIGLADEDAERGATAAQTHGLRQFASYEALLAERPDAVLVCSENSRHRPLVELAAAAGVHVLCEKPLATTLEDAHAMIAACERAGVTLMTAFPMRFSQPLIDVKTSLDAGDIGEPFCFNATNQGQLPKRHRAWFVDPELAGGGAVMDHTVHLTDVMRWYLGSEVVEVYAQTNHILYSDEAQVETGGVLMLTFANGVFATIDCSWSKPLCYPTWGGLGFELVTDRGAVVVDAFRQNLLVHRAATGGAALAYWGSNADQAMIDSFLAAVRAGAPPPVSGMDGYRALEIVHAAYESARTGEPVALAPRIT